jgi:hypothetical protein
MLDSSLQTRVGSTCRVLLMLLAALFVACDDELPEDACKLGDSRCDGHQLETCNSEGSWESRLVAGQCGLM